MKILNRLVIGALIYFGQENKILEFWARKNKIDLKKKITNIVKWDLNH